MNKDINFNDYLKLPGVWDYFGTLILMLLPIVGIIAAVVMAFPRRTHTQKRRLAKAMLLVHLCLIMLTVLLVGVGGYFAVSFFKDHPYLKNAVEYFKAYTESGINGVVSKMDETGDLKTFVSNIDFSETFKNVDIQKALEDVDIRVIIDSINTEKLLDNFGNINTNELMSNFTTKNLIEFIGEEKIAKYIDFEELVKKVDTETLERWLKLLSEYINGQRVP